MKLMDIQTHSDYVELMNATHLKKWELHRKRVEFGRQPLTLGMFVPINEKGEVLEEPDIKNHFLSKVAFRSSYTRAWKEYDRAKGRVLFEGISTTLAKTITERYSGMGVEGLLNIDREITLTQSAIKKLGL